jgi:hypothetical protein
MINVPNVRIIAICATYFSFYWLVASSVTGSPIFTGLLIATWLVCIFCAVIILDEKQQLNSNNLVKENASCLPI